MRGQAVTQGSGLKPTHYPMFTARPDRGLLIRLESMMKEETRAACIQKLKELGAPTGGWTCTEVEDLGEAYFICELCGYDKIRFVHTMKHPDWPKKFKVGCVCDGFMSGDEDGAEERDAAAKALADRKARHFKKEWLQITENEFILKHSRPGIRAVKDSFAGRDYFKLHIGKEQYHWFCNQRMTSLELVQKAAFEFLEDERKANRAETRKKNKKSRRSGTEDESHRNGRDSRPADSDA